MSLATTERAALADLFEQVGPDEPTLCDGWQTLDLLTHLLVREREPLGAIGNMVKPLQSFTAKAQDNLHDEDWDELIRRYRSGPPIWNPMGWGPLNALTNGGEMFIHHEDVRRAQPGWRPRELDARDTAELTKMARSGLTRLAVRRADMGVQVRLPGQDPFLLRRGEPVVTLTGGPAEVVLWIAGRDAVELEFDGDPAAVGKLRTLQRGL